MNNGIAAAIGATILFGLSTPLAKLLIGDIHPLVLAGLLYGGSGVGLLVLIGLRRSLSAAPPPLPHVSEMAWLCGAIFFGGVCGPALLMFGLATTMASTASLLLNLEGVFTALIAWFWFHENFDRRVAVGMALIVAGGIALAWTPGATSGSSLGLALVGAACLCWAIDNNLTRHVSAGDPLVIACLKGLVAGAVNLSLAAMMGVAVPALSAAASAMTIGFAGYGLSLVLFVLALRNLGTARTGAYFSLAPFFGTALAFLLHHEPFTAQLVAAGGLMAWGVWLHLSERHSHRHEHAVMTHTHMHRHDEHHRHTHDNPSGEEGEHSHEHGHEPLVHSHHHFPDIHHRHSH